MKRYSLGGNPRDLTIGYKPGRSHTDHADKHPKPPYPAAWGFSAEKAADPVSSGPGCTTPAIPPGNSGQLLLDQTPGGQPPVVRLSPG
ncbi:MAG: hypothetical protein QNJ58_26330 [Desulfobacterales bacterium]|nr:hypothetical protein [Desulfobacterales bacterium]